MGLSGHDLQVTAQNGVLERGWGVQRDGLNLHKTLIIQEPGQTVKEKDKADLHRAAGYELGKRTK